MPSTLKQIYMFRIIIGFAIVFVIFSCEKKAINSAPEISLEIFPFAGDTSTAFHFDLSQTKDNEDLIENLLSRFDWNSDGIWDTGFDKLKPVIKLFSEKGMHYITAEVRDVGGLSSIQMDSLYIFTDPTFGEMLDSRDGQKYKTVFLGNRWWMAEHLRYGTQILSGTMPKDDGIVEFYLLNDKYENLARYGGLYAWDEAMAYSNQEGSVGICPQGWHIPSDEEWKSISQHTARVFLSYLHGPDGPSGMNLQLGGSLMILQQKLSKIVENVFMPEDYAACFWSSSKGQRKLGVIDEESIIQGFQIGYYMNPSINDHNNPLISGFQRQDNLFPAAGNPLYYINRNLIMYQIYAHSIRCIKDL